ncbi:MAG: type II toxin-antitoxin system RelE family toxin [Nocardioidaceae bacterium]
MERILELAEDMADIRAAEQARAEMQTTGATPRDYRIGYEIEEDRPLVLVLSVGHRREIYKLATT